MQINWHQFASEQNYSCSFSRQKYHYLENLYKFCSLVCCAVSVSNEYIFPVLFTVGYVKLKKTGHNKKKTYMFLTKQPKVDSEYRIFQGQRTNVFVFL